jgi:transcriptional regulator with XRE-family HTH domain
MSRAIPASLIDMKRHPMSDEEIGAILAQNLKRARVRAGLQQRQVAAALDTNEMQVSRWENRTTTPHVVTLHRLATLYDVPIDILYVKDHPLLPPVPEKPMRPDKPPKPVTPKSRSTGRSTH